MPWTAVEETLRSIGPLPAKILLDATNPLRPDLSVLAPASGSGGQQVAEWAPDAHVVKAFNTIGARFYGDPAFDVLYCGENSEAKSVVGGLIEDTKMHPVDVGPLRCAAHLEHLAALWIDLAVNGRIQGAFGLTSSPRTRVRRTVRSHAGMRSF